jgi:exodeoxyribonuclease VII small subunit
MSAPTNAVSPANPSSPAPADPTASPAVLPFEAVRKRLEAVVAELERGELPLESQLARFEEGVRLVREAQARLDQAEQRVEELLAVAPDGRPVTKPFAVSDDRQPGRGR